MGPAAAPHAQATDVLALTKTAGQSEVPTCGDLSEYYSGVGWSADKVWGLSGLIRT